MSRRLRFGSLLPLLLLVAGEALCEPHLLDRIVAVVDDQVVLWSDLELRTLLELQQDGRNPAFLTDGEVTVERQRVLGDMVDELIVVKKAQKDSIEIDASRVEELLGDEFARLKGAMEPGELEQMLERSGMTERQLKFRQRKKIRHQLLYEQMVSQLAYRQFITRRDVDAFREAHFGTLPPKVSISQIQLLVSPADSILARARSQVERIQERLDAGEDFADVARRMSEHRGTAGDGGDLGCFSPGTLMPAFERAAFDLRPGEVSVPVLTSWGYHLIRLREKREGEVCASHILVRARTSPSDKARVEAQLEDLRRRAVGGEDFAQLARDHSQDASTARQGGLWQILPREAIPPSLDTYIGHLGFGDVSEPFFVENSGHILKINDDYATLEALVREQRVTLRMEELIRAYREEIYVEERLDEEWLWDPLLGTAIDTDG